jgi:hypothetical protein
MQKNKDRLSLSDENRNWCRSLVIIILFLISANAHAQRLSGHFLISTSKLTQSLEKIIVQKKPIVGIYEQPLTLPSTIPISINSVEYFFNWSEIKFDPIENGHLKISFVQPTLEIKIPKLDIDTYVIQEVNGVILKVRIKSTCNEIRLATTTDALSLQTTITGSARSEDVDLNAAITALDLGTPHLSVQDFNCDNIAGFEDVVSDEILQQFGRIDFYKPMLLEKVNSMIAQQLGLLGDVAEDTIHDQVIVHSSEIIPLFQLLAINSDFIDIGFAINSEDALLSPLKDYKATTDATLVVDKSELQNYLKEALSKKLSQSQYSSKNISELDKLTRSRFKQFFVWPALMKRPKGAELILRPKIESLNFNLTPNTVVKNLSMKATTGLWIIDGSEPMIYLRSEISANSTMTGGHQFQSKINSLKTSPIWNNSYIEKRNCSKRISTGIVDKLAEKYFTDNWATANLGVIKFANGVSTQLKQIYFDHNNKLHFSLILND